METAAAAITTSTDQVLVTRDGPIVTLTFNRPEARNAMTWEMYQRLYDTCEEVDADDSIRVLVLKGAGGKAFGIKKLESRPITALSMIMLLTTNVPLSVSMVTPPMMVPSKIERNVPASIRALPPINSSLCK